MQFIGTGFKLTDKANYDLIRDKASDHDLLVSKTITDGPFREGLQDFTSLLDIEVFQFSAFNEDDKKASSRQISDNLMAFHDQGKEDHFITFFTTELQVLPKTVYLIFACDWMPGNPVRLERIQLKELKSYFERNNSWYLWLYNYSAKRYYPKLDLPLILEITKE